MHTYLTLSCCTATLCCNLPVVFDYCFLLGIPSLHRLELSEEQRKASFDLLLVVHSWQWVEADGRSVTWLRKLTLGHGVVGAQRKGRR
jgi:hypothetical protein